MSVMDADLVAVATGEGVELRVGERVFLGGTVNVKDRDSDEEKEAVCSVESEGPDGLLLVVNNADGT